MAKTGGGSIVNISSIMGFIGGPSGHPAYSASKGAVRIYTKSAAVRYGPFGIRVNSVHPGYMPPMLNATPRPPNPLRWFVLRQFLQPSSDRARRHAGCHRHRGNATIT